MNDSLSKSLIGKLEELKWTESLGDHACPNYTIDQCIAIIRQHTAAPDVVERILRALFGAWDESNENWKAMKRQELIAAMGGGCVDTSTQVATPPTQASEISVISQEEWHSDLARKVRLAIFEGYMPFSDPRVNIADVEESIYAKLRPYLRTTEPVSLKDVMRNFTVFHESGGMQDLVKRVLDAAGVPYVD